MIGFIRRLVNFIRLSKAFSYKNKIIIEGVELDTTGGHMLKTYQEKYRCYDQFFKFISNIVPDNSIIIDVGANIGDTIAAMAAGNSSHRYVAIEPDKFFFKILTANTEKIKNHYSVDIECVNAFISKNERFNSLIGNDSTKYPTWKEDSDKGSQVRSLTLDSLSESFKASHIGLIKSDVDGYDYDVVLSAIELIKKNSPVLYFECDFRNTYQLTKFKELIQKLMEVEYSSFYLFDNFGNYLTRVSEYYQIVNFLEYSRDNGVGKNKNIYYFDVMAICSKDNEVADKAIEQYKLFCKKDNYL
jgi:FkbM family methyltransferase